MDNSGVVQKFSFAGRFERKSDHSVLTTLKHYVSETVCHGNILYNICVKKRIELTVGAQASKQNGAVVL